MNPYIYRQIKERLQMEEVFARYGIEVKKQVALCPFHNEKTASCRVYADSYYCFGCGSGGDVIDFVSHLLNLTKHDAAMQLNEDFALGLHTDKKPNFRTVMRFEQEKEAREQLQKFKTNALNILEAWYRYLWRQRQNVGSVDFFVSLVHLDEVGYYIRCISEDAADFKQSNERTVKRIEQELKCRGLAICQQ